MHVQAADSLHAHEVVSSHECWSELLTSQRQLQMKYANNASQTGKE